MEKKVFINIATLPISVKIETSFVNIQKLLSKFKSPLNKTSTNLKIHIKKSSNRSIIISKNLNKLTITGNDIDNLNNPFNIIGIIQAIFRFAGFHLPKKKIFLVHGSSAILNNSALCFGDDGYSTAKTLSSLEIAMISKKYIADEFCFFDLINKKIFGYSFIPIHLRPDVKNHLIKKHKFIFPLTHYEENNAGYFINSDKIFKNIKTAKLKAFLFTHFKNIKDIKLLTGKESVDSIRVCLTAHMAKLIWPYLDKMQFSNRKDSTKTKKYQGQMIKNVSSRLGIENQLKEIASSIPAYKTTVKLPCDLIKLIDKL